MTRTNRLTWLAVVVLAIVAFCALGARAATDKPMVLIGGKSGTIPSTDALGTNAATTGNASIVMPHGTAPTGGALVDGACWTTTAGLYCRINGSTVGPYNTGGGSVTSVTCGTGLSGGTITTTGTCSITAPVTVALGGTNATSASGTALDNITGFASTGFLTRTGAGTYAFQSATNGITLGNLAQIATNTVLANATSGTANIAAFAMPSCSTVSSALIWTTNTGFGCQSPVPTNTADPFIIGPAQIGAGAGTPPISVVCSNSAGEGSLCMRTDLGFLYSMWTPPTVIPARVQEALAQDSYSATLGASPTPGNYLIAVIAQQGGVATPNTGWTSFATQAAGSSGPAVQVAYHFVVIGDGAVQTPASGSPSAIDQTLTITEVSGLDAVNFANSLQATVFHQGTNSPTTAAATSTTINTLGVASATYSHVGTGTCGGGGLISFNAGWSHTITAGGNIFGIAPVAATSEAFPSNGSSISAQASITVTGGCGFTTTLVVLQPSTDPLTTGFQQLSYLTTVQNGGSSIATNARSLNFSTGLTAAADADSNITVTSTPTFTGDVTNSAFVLTIGANKVVLGDIAQIGADNILGNFTGSTANVGTQAIPDCPTSNDALYYVGSTHTISCHAPSGAGGGTVTSVTCDGVVITASGICPPGLVPQGRLTLTTGVSVMTSDQTAKATVYYDCYVGKFVPYYDGSNDQAEAISSCEVSLTMVAGASTVGGDNTTTGGINNAGVFDVWWVHGGASRICIANGVASSHSGGGWSSDTGGSTTARGSGYSAVHNTRGYWTNTNSIAHCWNGSTDYGSVSADQGTYLGSIFTTAAGVTGVAQKPTAANGGGNPTVGLWNAYNRVPIKVISLDNTTGNVVYSNNTWHAMDASNSNRVTFVDGLGQSSRNCYVQVGGFVGASTNSGSGCNADATSGTPNILGQLGSATSAMMNSDETFPPAIGLHFYQAMEARIFGSGAVDYQYNSVGQVQETVLTADY